MIKVKDLLLSCGNLDITDIRIHNDNYGISYNDFNTAIKDCGDKTVIIFKICNNTIDILISKND